jgi:hypothetical protein
VELNRSKTIDIQRSEAYHYDVGKVMNSRFIHLCLLKEFLNESPLFNIKNS